MPEGLTQEELGVAHKVIEARKESLRTDKKRGGFVPKKDLARIVAEEGSSYIGSGCERLVFQTRHRKDSGKVVAINYRELTPQKAKRTFYLQRVLSTLFPHNFPHFYAAIGSNPNQSGKENITGTVREERKGREMKDYSAVKEAKERKGIMGFLRGKIRYPFGRVLQICKSLSLPVFFDYSPVNYEICRDGGVYFLDTPWCEPGKWDLPRILEYMDKAVENGEPRYDKLDKRIMERSIRRLTELGSDSYQPL